MIDDRPTPRQSGSYAVMADICASSLVALAAWRKRLDKRAEEWPVVLLAIENVEDEFRRLAARVDGWNASTPDPVMKTATIQRILDLRNEADTLAKRYGRTL